MREIVLDTETTGLDYRGGDRVIEVACVELVNHVATNKHLQFYCSTDRAITDEAMKTHGLSNTFLKEFPPFIEGAQNLLKFIQEDTLIIHNAEFDLGFINNELKLSGLEPLKNKFIDTVLLARKKLNTRTANLDYLCRRFSIDLSARKIHGALLDCRLLSEVYLELLGGRQTSLTLTDKSFNKMDSSYEKKPKTKKIHQIYVSSEEIKKHKEFVVNLKNTLWSKIEY